MLIEKAYERRATAQRERAAQSGAAPRPQSEPEMIGQSAGDAGGVPADRTGRPDRQGDSDPGRKRHRQGTGGPGAASSTARGPTSRWW